MAALLLETLGGGPQPLGPRFNAKARSREYLRRGLILSGAIHLMLLYAFLHWPGRDGDLTLRTINGRVDLIPKTNSFMPPVVQQDHSPPHVEVPPDEGQPVPIPDDVLRPRVDANGVPPSVTGTESGNEGRGAAPSDEPPSLPPPPEDAGVWSLDRVDQAPVPVRAPKPVYPEIARENGITGTVVTEALVTVDGSVAKVRIKSGNKILSEAAQDAIYRWRFTPAQVRGRPVAVWVEVPVNFTL